MMVNWGGGAEVELMTIVVMFSGGIDSTYLLWQYLLKKEADIHVHHIGLKNDKGNRWKSENRAVSRILDYMRKNVSADFDFSTSVLDFTMPYRGIADLNAVTFMGFHVAESLSGSADPISSDNLPPDIKNRLNKDDVYMAAGYHLDYAGQDWLACTYPSVKKLESLWNHLKDNSKSLVRDMIYPLKSMTKQETVLGLPKEIRSLTSYCRSPDENYNACGRCHTCKQVEESLKPQKEGT